MPPTTVTVTPYCATIVTFVVTCPAWPIPPVSPPTPPPTPLIHRPVSLWAFYAYFLRLGATGFGGPIALAGFMQRDLVEERRWISRQDYLDGLALAQLAPGPLAAQLAMYLGYVRAGVVGATIVSLCFVLPSFLMVWAISVAYVRFGGLVVDGGLVLRRRRRRHRDHRSLRAQTDTPHAWAATSRSGVSPLSWR